MKRTQDLSPGDVLFEARLTPSYHRTTAVEFQTFTVIATTPEGAWIVYGTPSENWIAQAREAIEKKTETRRSLGLQWIKRTNRRFRLLKAEALHGFRARSRRRIRLLRAQLQRAELGLALATKYRDDPEKAATPELNSLGGLAPLP